MPPLNSRATREIVKRRNAIPGPRSLHRGIHFTENDEFVRRYKQNNAAQRGDHRDLLVHHQKINEDLQDVYARTAALHAEDATMEERIEESWRQFERIGGKRPNNMNKSNNNMNNNEKNKNENNNNNNKKSEVSYEHLRNNRGGVGFAARLEHVAAEKKDLRQRAHWERETRGDAVNYANGSALHAAKDKRIALFQRRQLRREHLLRRVGDPTPMKQSGRYDLRSGTLRVFNKTIRKVQREVRQDARMGEVKTRRKGSRTMWDSTGGDENPNRPEKHIVRYTREFDLGPRRQKNSKKAPRR